MSVTLWIFLSGNKWFISKYSTLMFHNISFGDFDKLEPLKENIVELERLRDMLINTVLSNSKITSKKINNVLSHKKMVYII